MTQLTSIVIPVYNEGPAIVAYLQEIEDSVAGPHEVLVVHDMAEDTTVAPVSSFGRTHPAVRPVLNTYGPGPANAIRFGMDLARGDVVVVTMADGSDEAALIESMAALVRDGYVVVAASRYMRGGRQEGGPILKRTLSRLAGLTLYHAGRVGTHDATNSYKAYSTGFIREVGVDSRDGFEIGIELVAKARRLRKPVTEVPTVWSDRDEGTSRFRVAAWIPKYVRWYAHAFGPRAEVRRIEVDA